MKLAKSLFTVYHRIFYGILFTLGYSIQTNEWLTLLLLVGAIIFAEVKLPKRRRIGI